MYISLTYLKLINWLSFFSDAVTVVLYHLFEALAGFDEVSYKEVHFHVKYVNEHCFFPKAIN